MIEWYQAIVLAIVQGLTEFLPISSSAHLAISPILLGWPDQGLAFDIAVHVGTLSAVIFYYRKDLNAMALSWFASLAGGKSDSDSRLVWYLAIATVPVGIVGVTAGDFIGSHFRAFFRRRQGQLVDVKRLCEHRHLVVALVITLW